MRSQLALPVNPTGRQAGDGRKPPPYADGQTTWDWSQPGQGGPAGTSLSFGRPTPYGMGYNHRIDTHQANTWPKPSPQAASRGTMTAAEAIAAAEAEGLALRTAETATGYRHVWPNPGNASKPFVAQLHGGSNGREKPHGKEKYLGIFATAEEAALAVARHLGAKVRSIGPTYSLTAAEAHAAAAAEGLTLVKANTLTGYKGVSRRQVGSIHPHTCAYSPYQVHITRHGVSEYLGAFATVEEAALEYARKVKAEETAEPPPMTAEEAYAAAAAEGLELLRAEKNASGFKGVQRHEHNAKRPFKAVLHVLKEQEEQWHMEGRDPKKKGPLLLKHTPDDPDAPKEKPKEWHGASASSGVLGNFATAEEAALAYARSAPSTLRCAAPPPPTTCSRWRRGCASTSTTRTRRGTRASSATAFGSRR